MTQGLILLFQMAPALRSAGGRVAAGTLCPMAAPSRLAVVHCHARAHAQDAHSSLRQHHSLLPGLCSTMAPQHLPGHPSPLQG